VENQPSLYERLDLITQKISVLTEHVALLNAENDKLQQEITDMHDALAHKDIIIKSMEKRNSDLLTQAKRYTAEETLKIRRELDNYIREIDRYIEMLQQHEEGK
jgi:small-conductance mechanosensitive channel